MRLLHASICRRTGRRQAPTSKALVVVSVLALILAVGALAASCGGSTATTGAVPTTATTPGATTGGAAGTAQVAIKNLAFDPATVTIGVGDTVTWTNEESTKHNVVADNGEFESSMLAIGATFSNTFATPGTYSYHCGVHPSMTGKVIVQ